jgi:hypothetical protein
MAASRYKRPLICQFCSFPAADKSVRLSKLDRVKLSEWFVSKLGAEPDEKEYNESVFCAFCVMDAKYVSKARMIELCFTINFPLFPKRFEGEFFRNNCGEEPCDWWSRCEHMLEYDKYYNGK